MYWCDDGFDSLDSLDINSMRRYAIRRGDWEAEKACRVILAKMLHEGIQRWRLSWTSGHGWVIARAFRTYVAE